MIIVQKTAGVLGGMGPDATVDFMAKVIAATPADKDQDHVPMLIDHNTSVPNRQTAILEDGPDPSAELARMGRRLEAAGADFLVMVCNSAHAFAAELDAAVSIPLVSIIDVTVEVLSHDINAVGILATDGCLASGLFQEAIESTGRKWLLPREPGVADMMRLINAIKAGDRGDEIAGRMERIARELVEEGADAIIAGCTEIPLVLKPDRIGVPLVSSTDALAQKTVALASGKEPLPHKQ